jgi:hypothetical protein
MVMRKKGERVNLIKDEVRVILVGAVLRTVSTLWQANVLYFSLLIVSIPSLTLECE